MSSYTALSTERPEIERRVAPANDGDADTGLESAVAAGRRTEALRVLHIARTVGRRSFGVGAVALSLGAAQRAIGCRVENWSVDTADELAEVLAGRPGVDHANHCCRIGHVHGFARVGGERLAFTPSMYRAIGGSRGAQFQIVHQHGIWSACSLATHRWRSKYDRPTVITPHGTLEAWALRKSKLKKWFAGHLFERRNLSRASCIHALTAREAAACREFGLRNPVALIPNGVSQSWLDSRGDGERFRNEFGIPADTRVMLFLSRVTPKKGLPMLLEAIADVKRCFDDWLLVVAGPDEYGHSRELAELAAKLKIERRVRLTGPLYGESRRDAFAAADVFVLPTRSEGHPLVALEALGAGVPVLTTTGACCDFIPMNRCGWQTETNTASLQEGLRAALGCESAELTEMGQRGKEYVEKYLTWNVVAEQTVALYRWLAGHGARPEFVSMD